MSLQAKKLQSININQIKTSKADDRPITNLLRLLFKICLFAIKFWGFAAENRFKIQVNTPLSAPRNFSVCVFFNNNVAKTCLVCTFPAQ